MFLTGNPYRYCGSLCGIWCNEVRTIIDTLVLIFVYTSPFLHNRGSRFPAWSRPVRWLLVLPSWRLHANNSFLAVCRIVLHPLRYTRSPDCVTCIYLKVWIPRIVCAGEEKQIWFSDLRHLYSENYTTVRVDTLGRWPWSRCRYLAGKYFSLLRLESPNCFLPKNLHFVRCEWGELPDIFFEEVTLRPEWNHCQPRSARTNNLAGVVVVIQWVDRFLPNRCN